MLSNVLSCLNCAGRGLILAAIPMARAESTVDWLEVTLLVIFVALVVAMLTSVL